MRSFVFLLAAMGLSVSQLFAGNAGARPSFLDRGYSDYRPCDGPFSVWIDPKTPRFALVSAVGITGLAENESAMKECVRINLVPVLQKIALSGKVESIDQLQIDLFGPDGGKFNDEPLSFSD